MGASAASVAFAWLVYASRHEALDITLLGVANFAPALGIGLIGGALADRYARRRMMIVSDIVRALAVALLALFLAVRGFDLAVVVGTAVVVSAMGALFGPASNALLPQLVPGEALADANGLLGAGETGGGFVGTALGGILIAVVGVATDFSLNALTYVISAGMLAFVVLPPGRRAPRSEPEPAGSLLSEVREGFAYVRGQGALLWTILSSLGANFFLAIYGTYEVVYVVSFLRVGPALYGLLAAMNGVGFGAGSVLAGRLRSVHRAGAVCITTWSLGGLLIVELALVRSVPNALVVFAAVGVLLGLGNTTYQAYVQRVVPEPLLGRYFSIEQVGGYATTPLGQVAGGLLLVLVGVSTTYAIIGAGAFACSIALLLSRDVRRLAYPPLPAERRAM